MADNFHFDMTGVHLPLALQVAFTHHKTAVGWQQDKLGETDRLVLFWTPVERPNINLFPSPLDPEQIEPLIQAWLIGISYGPQPDHDGDNGKGFRIWNDAWGHIDGHGWQAFAAIEPVWLMYGK